MSGSGEVELNSIRIEAAGAAAGSGADAAAASSASLRAALPGEPGWSDAHWPALIQQFDDEDALQAFLTHTERAQWARSQPPERRKARELMELYRRLHAVRKEEGVEEKQIMPAAVRRSSAQLASRVARSASNAASDGAGGGLISVSIVAASSTPPPSEESKEMQLLPSSSSASSPAASSSADDLVSVTVSPAARAPSRFVEDDGLDSDGEATEEKIQWNPWFARPAAAVVVAAADSAPLATPAAPKIKLPLVLPPLVIGPRKPGVGNAPALAAHLVEAEHSRLGPKDRVSRLPPNLLRMVMACLDGGEVAGAAVRVSPRWDRTARDRQLWKKLMKSRFALPVSVAADRRSDFRLLFSRRYAEELTRTRVMLDLPGWRAKMALENSLRWQKGIVHFIHSGWVGLIHAVCLLVWLILLDVKLGGHFPSSAAAPNGDRDWSWRFVCAPAFLSAALVVVALLSFVVLRFYPALDRAASDMRGLPFNLLRWMRREDDDYSDEPSVRQLLQAGLTFLGPHLSVILAAAKLDSQAACFPATCEHTDLTWPVVCIPFAATLFFWIGMWIKVLWEWVEEDRWHPGVFVPPLEAAALLVSMFLSAWSIGEYRADALNDPLGDHSGRSYAAAHWALWCLLPVWIAHTLGALWIMTDGIVHGAMLTYDEWEDCCTRWRKFLGMFSLWLLGNIFARSPLIAVELMLWTNMDRSFAHARQYPPSATDSFQAPIDDSIVFLPLMLPAGIAVLAYGMWSLWELERY